MPGVAVTVVGENDLLWERGFGLQDVARSLPAQPDTPYFIDGLTQLLEPLNVITNTPPQLTLVGLPALSGLFNNLRGVALVPLLRAPPANTR